MMWFTTWKKIFNFWSETWNVLEFRECPKRYFLSIAYAKRSVIKLLWNSPLSHRHNWIIHIAQKILHHKLLNLSCVPVRATVRTFRNSIIKFSYFVLVSSKTNGLTDHVNINKAFEDHLYDCHNIVTDMFMWAFYTFAIIIRTRSGLSKAHSSQKC